jgi:two-component system, OmpR family, sensor kinase
VAQADDADDPPAGVWLALRQPDGQLEVTPGAPAGLPGEAQMAAVAANGVPESGDVQLDGVIYQVDTVRHADGTVVQGMLDLTANHADRYTLVGVLVAAGALGLLLAAASGTWLGRRALRPLTTVIAIQRRFVADAGHELRTPVTLLNVRAQLLRRKLQAGAAPQEAWADLDGIVADSARLGEVLEDLSSPRTRPLRGRRTR